MNSKSNIGLIGLAVMGENLALNMERNGWQVSVWNRTTEVVDNFINGRAKGKNIVGCESLEDFTTTLETPRIVMMMVRAGNAVDEVIEKIVPYLSEGDILSEGGNSYFKDTERRVKDMYASGFYFVGAGVSGGEEGALNGPSIMPGGAAEAWPRIKPILQSIAAKANGTPCCEWVGPGGSGHFVKMIHNGIEYGDMQLISEAYFLLKHLQGMGNAEMGDIFARWNEGKLKSYLIEITGHILLHKDVTGAYLLDRILDVAGQKGTGKWSVINALELSIPLELIATAVFERYLSSEKLLRMIAAKTYPRKKPEVVSNKEELIEEIHQTLYAAKLVSYAQGFGVLKKASETYDWKLNLATIARLWRAGCIIRSTFLDDIAYAFEQDSNLENLLLASHFSKEIQEALPYWKKLVATAAHEEISSPAFSSALNYFYSLTTDRLPANLIQAQRDYFGAHTFERVDEEPGKFFHENWTGHGGNTKSGTYNA